MSEPSPMVAATWAFVERHGIPDTRMRRMLFELAEMIGTDHAEELTLASAAYRGLQQQFDEEYTYARMPPLQQQLEYIRIHKDLEQMLGTGLPMMDGDAFKLHETPHTPTALADALGYQDARPVRRLLRARYPDHQHGTAWHLTDEQVNYVRAHLNPRR